MTQSGNLSGQVALVTGGTRGIGFAICEALASRGANVVATGSSQESVDALNSRKIAGIQAIVADARSERDMLGAVNYASQIEGRLSCVVSCAGKSFRGNVLETSLDEWDKCLDLNLKAAFLAAQVALPKLKHIENANIVFVSSIWAVTATVNRVAYSVAKTGLSALTRNLAIDHGVDGIRVNAIAPGYIQTELFDEYLRQISPERDLMKDIIARHPLRRIGTPRDIGAAAGFLASPDASFITGQTLIVDGGITSQFALAML